MQVKFKLMANSQVAEIQPGILDSQARTVQNVRKEEEG